MTAVPAAAIRRAWLLGLATLFSAALGLSGGVALLPDPWPAVVATLLATGLVLLLALQVVGTWMGTTFRLVAGLHDWVHFWVARFAPDPGAILFDWAAAAGDLPRAARFLEAAARRGYPPAIREQGRWILEGGLGPAARGAGLPWIERAAAAGDVEALFWLGEARRWALGCPRDLRGAHEANLWAAKRGYRPAVLRAATDYLSGEGVDPDETEASDWLRRASGIPGEDLPPPPLLHQVTERGGRVAAELREMLEAADQLADRGWTHWSFRVFVAAAVFLSLGGVAYIAFFSAFRPLSLGLLFCLGLVWVIYRGLGHGLPGTPREQRSLETRAAGGDDSACYELGLRFERGHPGLAPDPVAARHYYQVASDAGHPQAALHLADFLAWGKGGPRDMAQARTLLEALCRRGHPEALVRLQRLGIERVAVPADRGEEASSP
ncbi:MAG: sel1 repeat family protein [Acidobacteria bacterium]|nr:sel1 repeat family protein [Acidobacteriota bacterium]